MLDVGEVRGRERGQFRAGISLFRLGLALLFFLVGRGQLQGQDQVVLDNGLVRVSFDQRTHLFEAYSLLGSPLRLIGAGPAFQKDGQTISATEADSVETRRESAQDQIGQGEKLVVGYHFKAGIPDLRYELTIYRDRPWVSVTSYFPRGAYRLGDFEAVRGKLLVQDAFKSRIFVCSGEAGGDSGVWELGMRQWSSGALSVLFEPKVQDAVGLGFYSFHRASTSVITRYLSSTEVGVEAAAHYFGYQPQDEELRTESLLMNFSRDPLKILEEWADAGVKVVQPKFNHDTRMGVLNPWYIYGNEITEAGALEQSKLLHDSIFPRYGIRSVIAGEWQKQRNELGDVGDSLGFGEDQEDAHLFPHGFKFVCDRIAQLGLTPAYGFNYAYAALQSSTLKKHPSWVIQTDLSRLDFGYPFDFTNPEARKWLYDLAHWATELRAGYLWTDFNGGPTRGTLHDPKKIMGFEDIREGLRAIREGAGPGVLRDYICCGPYFPSIGLTDRARTGNDMSAPGDWDGLKAIARQLAAMYMAHQRFWITDSDAIFVGGGNAVHDPGAKHVPADASTLDEIRMRLQLLVSSGSFPTLGEELKDLNPERTHLLTLVLPSYGQAARPVDLFTHTTPEIYDLKVQTDWDQWHVLMLQNWNDQDKSYAIQFSDLGLDAAKIYLVFRFWSQTLVGEYRGQVLLDVGARKGEAFVVREVPQHPWVLSTDMHLTQGGMELEGVRYEESSGHLGGVSRRHPGAEGQVVLFIPRGYEITSASGPYRAETSLSGANIVHLQLKFVDEAAPWSVTVAKQTTQVQ
jgi:hypothetical protein